MEALKMNLDDLTRLGSCLQNNLIVVAFGSICLIFSLIIYFLIRPRPVYLIDFSCYRAPDNHKASKTMFMEHSRQFGVFDESSLDFQEKISKRSGVGDEAYLPEAVRHIPPRPTIALAREEAEMVMFGALDNLFANTKLNPKDIDILVVNCALFNPAPSLSAMIVNKYKLRTDIVSFNLGGMGCSAGVIAVGLAKDLLQVYRNCNAVVVSTEIITLNWYKGNEKSMLISNCIFRVGGAAMLLSNKSSDKRRAKYKLLHVVRTHLGADTKAFNALRQQQDGEGNVGVLLTRDVSPISGKALKINMTKLGPLVLPISEQLLYLATLIVNKLFNEKVKPYVPDFRSAFDHFCIHAGGRAIIDELEKNLKLSPEEVEASRMTLHRFGNTSSSSIWYELGYIESKKKMRKGNRVWQIGLGGGFKCNSAVWVALRDIKPALNCAWSDCIDKYPVHLET
ncbi:3-ketoacyl-CoA synthase 4-like [Mercurialis annua]|uniref:3-ketoacyl-CoA synthase 4-like n=1 Tax=Mercurialis annua TaxID=3986 RepID=UPI00215E96EF|nr:3-ketoacyl-CoA synthase 4-like [Mercurialis annua]